MKTYRRIAAVLLCLATVLVAIPATPALAYSKATYDDIKNTTTEELKSQIDELNALLEETQQNLENAEKLQADAAERRQIYLTLESVYAETIGAMQDELVLINGLASELEAVIAKTEAEYAEEYQAFLDLIRMIYEEGTPNYVEIIIGAESFSDMLSRIERMRSVLGYSDTLMNKLLKQKEELTKKREEQLSLAADKEAGIAAMKAKQEELARFEEENENAISAIENQITELIGKSSEYEDRTDVLDAEFQEIVTQLEKEENERRAAEAERQRLAAIAAAESRRIAEEEARLKAIEEASRNQGFMWPVPWTENVISSSYGYRTHPVSGKENVFHYGIDIACPRGTNIYAAKGGVVTTATYHASYGYYILINHLDGTSTLYAHCNTGSLKVKKGDTVERGQIIAGVGTTGVSTGYHLHFEVRVNGKTVSPLDYVVNHPTLEIRD